MAQGVAAEVKRGGAGDFGVRVWHGGSPGITVTWRGSCAARKAELTGGPGWQRGEGATRAWALVVRGERGGVGRGKGREGAGPSSGWAARWERGRQTGLMGFLGRVRVIGLGCCWVWGLLGFLLFHFYLLSLFYF